MPNWCCNHVRILDLTPEHQATLVRELENENLFTNLVPGPDWKNIPNEDGELPVVTNSEHDITEFPSTGKSDDRWYHWRLNNWGSKWDVVGAVVHTNTNGELEFSFESAWSPPTKGLTKLSELMPEATFEHKFSEPAMDFLGAAYYQEGLSVVEDGTSPSELAEAYMEKNHPTLSREEDEDEYDETYNEALWDLIEPEQERLLELIRG